MAERVITAREAKLRWAYSEMTSERWGAHYEANAAPEIYAMAVRNESFDKVPAAAHDALLDVAYMARNKGFYDNLDASPTYTLVELNRAQLDKIYALWSLNPDQTGIFPFAAFRAGPPMRKPEGTVDPYDPRYVIQGIPPAPFVQSHAGIVFNGHGKPILIEGNLRSLLFVRDLAAKTFQVWWPAELALPDDTVATDVS